MSLNKGRTQRSHINTKDPHSKQLYCIMFFSVSRLVCLVFLPQSVLCKFASYVRILKVLTGLVAKLLTPKAQNTHTDIPMRPTISSDMLLL